MLRFVLINFTLLDEINSKPDSNAGHNNWLFEKSFLVRAIDEGKQKNKNIKINNFFILKGAFCCPVPQTALA